jgi:hypothetical protein
MAVYKIFPEKDATMYSLFPQMNTGLDEILQIGNLNFAIDTSPQVSRYLIKFDQNEIDSFLDTKVFPVTNNWKAYLKNYIATAQGIALDSRLYVYPASGAWGMGTGKYLDIPIVTNGVSWEWQTTGDGKRWDFTNFGPYVTASYNTNTNRGGGTWFTGSNYPGLDIVQTQTFTYHSDKDLNVDVTDTVEVWYTSSNGITGSYINIANEGFLVKWEGSSSYEDPLGNYYIEFNPNKNVQPVLQYYSRDTHTIYPPCLEIRWRDYSFNTGSSTTTIVNTDNIYASIANNAGFYYSQSIQRVRVDCRPKYPPVVFQTSSLYTTNYYLPTASYWAIKDLDTNEYIIDFDPEYTQISADNQSSYFDLYMNGLQPERYYTILIQTTINNSTMVMDMNYNFKVING